MWWKRVGVGQMLRSGQGVLLFLEVNDPRFSTAPEKVKMLADSAAKRLP